MYLRGRGADGTSTVSEVVQGIPGTGSIGYAATIDSSLLTSSGGSEGTSANFLGARIAFASEVKAGASWDPDRIKRAPEEIAYRGASSTSKSVFFEQAHMLWIIANQRLKALHHDAAFWRRLREIPFNHAVPAHEAIKGLNKILVSDEGAAILAWMLEGAKGHLQDGLDVPTSVVEANQAYKDEQDTVAAWIENSASTEKPEGRTLNSVLRESYLSYCKRERLAPLGQKEFSVSLKEAGFRPYKAGSVRGFEGIDLPASVYPR